MAPVSPHVRSPRLACAQQPLHCSLPLGSPSAVPGRLAPHPNLTPTPSPSVFDSSRGFLKQPFQFQIGAGDVIRGWDQGMLKMSKGEKATLTCTPDFACTREHIEPSAARRALGPPTRAERLSLSCTADGQRGAPPDIPPGATLEFDVELIGISGKPFF